MEINITMRTRDWAEKIQPLVNSICKKYGLTEISLKKDGEKEKEKNVTKEFRRV